MNIARPLRSFAAAIGTAFLGNALTEGGRLMLGRGASAFLAVVATRTVGDGVQNSVVVDSLLEGTMMMLSMYVYGLIHPHMNMVNFKRFVAACALMASPVPGMAHTAITPGAYSPTIGAPPFIPADPMRKAILEQRFKMR